MVPRAATGAELLGVVSLWSSFCANAAHQRRHLWQAERVAKKHGDVEALRHGIDKVEAVLNKVLGTP